MKIAILTRPDNRSPKILAETLKYQLILEGNDVSIFYKVDLLGYLVSFKESEVNFHFWLKKKTKEYFVLRDLLQSLQKFDVIVISEFIPNSFLRKLYNIESLKRIIKKPVLLYEVYYLGNAPTQIDFLKKNGDSLEDRYDFHLSVSDVTEIKQAPSELFYPIGIYAKSWNLKPVINQEIVAIIDFAHPGNQHYREEQFHALDMAGIKYISLEKNYTIDEIRNIYQQGSIYFMQSSEAFGLPILECLCCGCQIFTPFSAWPMSWRLDENPIIHAEGKLADCFTIYNGQKDLVDKLGNFKKTYDPTNTPQKIFQIFLKNYPAFYFGNKNELFRLMENLRTRYGINN